MINTDIYVGRINLAFDVMKYLNADSTPLSERNVFGVKIVQMPEKMIVDRLEIRRIYEGRKISYSKSVQCHLDTCLTIGMKTN